MKKRGRPIIYNNELDKKIRKLQLSKSDLKKIPFSIFKEWYSIQNDCCFYCGLSSNESYSLFKKYYKSTRNGKRGKSLELDRKNHLITDYCVLKNLCLACYWCNNSKTNYFSFDEFKIIGLSIKEIQKKRLLNDN